MSKMREKEETTAELARQQRSFVTLGEEVRDIKRELAEKIIVGQSAVDTFSNIEQHNLAECTVGLVIRRNDAKKKHGQMCYTTNKLDKKER